MYRTKTMKEKIVLFLKIMFPILISQIGIYAMNLFDTIMSGRVGAEDLAGVAIGSSLWLPVFTGLNGLLLSVSPIVAQHVGAGRRHQITESVMQALYLSAVLGACIILLGTIAVPPILTFMDLEIAVQTIANHYLVGLAFGVLPLFASSVLRYFFDALGYTRITMIIVLSAVPVNILFNYLLIFGKWIFPPLGGIGAGYATSITYLFIFIIDVVIVLRFSDFAVYQLFLKKIKPSVRAWLEQLKIGIPIGLSIFFESSIFAAVTLLMSQFSTTVIAAHQAAMNFTSLIFMLPLSISMALTITVGFEIGAERRKDAVQYSKLGISTAMGVLLLCSLGLYLFREQIAMLYSSDHEVIALAKQFLIFAIFYQLSDAAQASIQGVLRGYKDVTVPFFTALVSYWLIGLPIGFVLANYTFLEPFGYWVGITCGLTAAALGFAVRLAYTQRKQKTQALAK